MGLSAGALDLGSVLRWSAACLAAAVTALALSGCDFGDGGRPSAGTAETKAVLAPVGFSATADGYTVKLVWSAPSGSGSVVGYEITRNGRPLKSAPATATSVSDFVRYARTYRYEIRSKGVRATSEWVSDEVKVKTPPLREARVDGDYGVTARVLSKSGFDQYAAPNFAWNMAPKCREGACDVAWRAISSEAWRPNSFQSVHALLKQRGKHYAGTYHGYFGGTCHGTHSITSVDLRLAVVKAKPIEGQWLASRLEGVLTQSDIPQFGCVASRATVSVSASLRTPHATTP